MANNQVQATINIQTNANQATQQIQGTTSAVNELADATTSSTSATRGNSQAILENGGAVGTLNTLTGGLASTVKDAWEATQLLTKNTTINTVATKISAGAQAAYAAVVGTSTGAMKAFRIALAATGIGLIVIALGLLIANFDKVKKAVLDFIPGLKIVGDLIGGLVDKLTDFIGLTSDASRALDKMVADAEKSLKKNQDFLETDGDKFDEYTKRKIEAVNTYNEAVKKANEDETKSEEQKLAFIKKLKERADRDIAKADEDRRKKQEEENKKEQDKLDADAKKAADKAKADKAKRDAELAKLEQKRLDVEKKLADDLANLAANDAQKKLDLEKQREETSIKQAIEAGARREKALRDLDAKYNELQRQLDDENAKERLRLINAAQDSLEDSQDKTELERLERQRERRLEAINTEVTDEATKLELIRLLNEEFRIKREEQEVLDAEKREEQRVKLLEEEYNQEMARIDIKRNALDQISSLTNEETALGQALLIAKQALLAQELILDIKSSISKAKTAATNATVAGAEAGAEVASGAAKTAGAAPFPANIPLIIGYAATAIGIIASVTAAVKRVKGAKAPSASSTPTSAGAPNFNLIGSSQTSQLSSTIAGQQNQPIRTFVVASDVTTQQSLDRNIVNNATIG